MELLHPISYSPPDGSRRTGDTQLLSKQGILITVAGDGQGRPGALEEIQKAREELDAGEFLTAGDLRARFGKPLVRQLAGYWSACRGAYRVGPMCIDHRRRGTPRLGGLGMEPA